VPPIKTFQPKRGARHLLSALLISLLAIGIFHTFSGTPKASAAATELAASTQLTPEEQSAAKNQMSTWKAMVLGAVEGITEYLPISSTGHLVVTQRILGIGDTDATKDAADSYAIAIQFGAILAVLVLYRKRIESIIRGLFGRDTDGRNLLISLVIAFIPAVIIGVAIEKPIKSHLLNVGPVVGAWIVGGLLILFLAPKIKADRPGMSITHIRPKQALIIGCAQVLAMWPGTSRSLVTILAALAVGTTLAAAVEFSFLLGLMTLGAATLYETAKNGSTVVDAYGWFNPLVGLVFAFIFAALAVKWMVSWLQTRSLAVFGWERLAVAAVSIGLLIAGTI
jgi:undecaprenyl-diphosphatase